MLARARDDNQRAMSAYELSESVRVREGRAIRERGISAAERRGELIVGAAFIAGAIVLAVLGGAGMHISVSVACIYVLFMAAVGYVRFDIGAGFTVPTQLVFIPMLFALPAAVVPLLVALSLFLSMAGGVLKGDVSASRLLTVPGNSWFALGPALVLVLAGDHNPDGRWAILVLALLAQFACDFLSAALRERHGGGITLRELLDETRQVYLIDAALSPLGLLLAFALAGRAWALIMIAPLFGLLNRFSRHREAHLDQLIELNDAYRGTALVLGDVVEADDSYTGEHTRGVVNLALEVAREFRLDAERRRKVEFAALLHDVGKIAVPKEIINKPGALDDREWAIIRTHTVEGQRMLQRIGGLMSDVGEIVRASHERFDGKGYPDGLVGEEIPLEARIVACCDAYNAMTTDRSYRRAMTKRAALAELRDHAGTQFDATVVTVLERLTSELGDRPALELDMESESRDPANDPAPLAGSSAHARSSDPMEATAPRPARSLHAGADRSAG
jgi:putative nucleotidyltransferase with HDIG domain